ncbi:ATP-binding protein [Bacillus sp. V3-13]|uniref:ATP-binding protein n=1 Tax=Bacillus sp. V3-13 TaxID=2053728 RepID=UPI0015E0C5FC|nr:ATP-binding protein [Bacillus sp. V3-13]
MNILINSVQAVVHPGQITVQTSMDAGQDKVLIAFSDTGTGITDADIGKVFDPFFTTKKEGTGIGLAVVQRIILAHNGEISLSNIPSGGLRVTIQIPIYYSKRDVKI